MGYEDKEKYRERELEEEALKKKYAEETLDRKAKATVKWNYNCSIRAAKFKIKKEPLVHEVVCERCGRVIKTNRETSLCLSCEREQ
jgi:peptidyl-tRNA hydrolase